MYYEVCDIYDDGNGSMLVQLKAENGTFLHMPLSHWQQMAFGSPKTGDKIELTLTRLA